MTTELAAGFGDLTVLTTPEVEVFVLDLEAYEENPPYYVDIAGRRFAYSSITFPVKGHGSALPPFVREHEAEGRLVVLVERKSRYMAYVHDPSISYDDDDAGDEET